MGERTFMDTTDVNALAQRIQELEKENARLKAILDKNGIEYKSFESKISKTNHVEATPVSHVNSLYMKRFPYSKVYSKVEMMYLPSVGIVVRHKSPVISQYARENGIVNFAISENTSVRIVPISNSLL